MIVHCESTLTLTPDHRTAQPAYHISIWLNTGNCIVDQPYIVARLVQYWFNPPLWAHPVTPMHPLFL